MTWRYSVWSLEETDIQRKLLERSELNLRLRGQIGISHVKQANKSQCKGRELGDHVVSRMLAVFGVAGVKSAYGQRARRLKKQTGDSQF